MARLRTIALCVVGAASIDPETCDGFCNATTDANSLLQQAPRNGGMFTDVTREFLPPEMFAEWHHGDLTNAYTAPVVTDVNEDGVLDVFSANHCLRPGGWDFGLGRMVDSRRSRIEIPEYSLYTWTDHDPDAGRCTVDAHSIAIIDIDGDGLLDLFVTIGASRGQAVDETSDSAVLWGDGTNKRPHFSGARSAARTAGINNRGGRTRFVYVADFNGDGKLDVFIGNVVRADNLNIPSEMLINQGGRSFTPDDAVQEYTWAVTAHDVNMDHVADEFVLTRDTCLLGGRQNAQFCSTRRKGSLAVFKWSQAAGKMVEHEQSAPITGSKTYTVQSGDFDRDGFADLVVPRGAALWVFYSTRRSSGLDLGRPTTQNMGAQMKSVRVGDFDLDGYDDMLVIFIDSTYKMYEYNGRYGWTEKASAINLGDLGNVPGHMCHAGTLSSTKRMACNNGNQYGRPVETKGVTVADFNNDGYLDVVIAYNRGPTVYYMNNMAGNRFFQIRLLGAAGNKRGIGATVLFDAQLGNAGVTTQLREINHGGGDGDALGSRDDRITFGLGRAGTPKKVTVYWPAPSRAVSTIDEAELSGYVNSNQHAELRVLIVREEGPTTACAQWCRALPLTATRCTNQRESCGGCEECGPTTTTTPATSPSPSPPTNAPATACAQWCRALPLTATRCTNQRESCGGCEECGPTTTTTPATTPAQGNTRCEGWCGNFPLNQGRCRRFSDSCSGCDACRPFFR